MKLSWTPIAAGAKTSTNNFRIILNLTLVKLPSQEFDFVSGEDDPGGTLGGRSAADGAQGCSVGAGRHENRQHACQRSRQPN